jgi:hypothetical protein
MIDREDVACKHRYRFSAPALQTTPASDIQFFDHRFNQITGLQLSKVKLRANGFVVLCSIASVGFGDQLSTPQLCFALTVQEIHRTILTRLAAICVVMTHCTAPHNSDLLYNDFIAKHYYAALLPTARSKLEGNPTCHWVNTIGYRPCCS